MYNIINGSSRSGKTIGNTNTECRIQTNTRMQNTVQIKNKNIDRTDDIIAGKLSNKTLNPIRTNNLFCCAEKYQAKLNTISL